MSQLKKKRPGNDGSNESSISEYVSRTEERPAVDDLLKKVKNVKIERQEQKAPPRRSCGC